MPGPARGVVLRAASRAVLAATLAFQAAALAFQAPALASPSSPAQPRSSSPQRIVSLVPSLTETVCLLQACDRLVGVDRHSNWPAEVQGLPRLGGLDDTPLERLVALQPDLVLLPPSSRLLQRLQNLGIPALALPTQSHEDVRQALRVIGSRLERASAADQLWQQAQADIAQAAQRIPTTLRGRRVYLEVSSEPHAAGPTSFMGQTLAQLGMGNVVPSDLGPFPRLNPEFVVRAQPDVVMASASAFERMGQRPGWSTLPALADAACSLPGPVWEVLVRPGPRLGEAARVMADCLSRIRR